MADEANASQKTSSEDVSLENLVGKTGADSVTSASEPGSPKSSAAAPASGLGTLDEILAIEDPEFVSSMSELRAAPVEQGHIEIDSIDLSSIAELADDPNAGPIERFRRSLRRKWLALRELPSKLSGIKDPVAQLRRLIGASKSGLLHLSVWAKDSALAGLKAIGTGVSGFMAMPMKSKGLVLIVVVLGGLSMFTIKLAFSEKFLPRLQEEFLLSFSEVADAEYKIEPGDPMQDLMDPVFHPEHVVLFERIVVNLRSKIDEASPMGLFAFYIDVSTQEAAVELKDRETEARDIMSRTLEQMTYDDLATLEGKNRLKVALRMSLNDFLTRGRVRRVMFKNIVLKP